MISKIHELLKTKKISCVELVQKYLSAIDAMNDELIAYVNVSVDLALESAKDIDEKIASGEDFDVLCGVPMTLKDNISTKGIETTCCSNILKGYTPIYDASVWKKLKNKGSILLGKTNMDEFAMGSSCETSCFGGAKNPHNHKYVAGGSSGGVASAVGAGIAAYGLGSDTGGSIRQPASFCGLVGLKPTYGAVSRFGLIAYASSLDQIGPITTSAKDAAIVYDEIAFKDDMDSTCKGKLCDTVSHLNDDIKGLKIGIASEYFKSIDSEVEDSINKALDVYKSMGANVVDISLPSIDYALPVYYIIACAEASSNLGRYDGIRYGFRASEYKSIHEMISKTRSQGFGDEVKRRILLGTYVLSSGYYDAYYKKAQMLRGNIVNGFSSAFENCDVILAPTVPMTAFENGTTSRDPVEIYQTDICTVSINIAGLPAVSLPCGFDSKKLPIGMQLIGPKFSEANLLCLANKFEQATDRCFFKNIEGGINL